MQEVATPLAAPYRANLGDADVAAVSRALTAAGAAVVATHWLNPGIACDVVFPGADRRAAAADLARRFEAAPFDLVVQRRPGRRKDLLVADMDATTIGQETLDVLAAVAGIADRIAPITERAMNGEIGFADALRARVALFAGLHVSALEAAFDRLTLTPGARTLVQTMRAHGAYTVLVSGGFTYFTGRVRSAAGFDRDIANLLGMDGDNLDGTVSGPVMGPDAKREALLRVGAERHIPMKDALAVGDGANDIPMLQAAGLGVAFHPKPVVAAAVDVRLRHADLTGLLYLQGYSVQEFRA